MPKIFTLGDIVDFVLKYRRGNSFVGWTIPQIALEIKRAYDNNHIIIHRDEDEIKSIAIWDTLFDTNGDKFAHVRHLLAAPDVKRVYKLFYEFFNKRFDYKYFTGRRDGGKIYRYEFRNKSLHCISSHDSI